MQSPRFKLNKEDAVSVLQVFAWTVASACVAGLINLMQLIEFPPELLWLIPMINTGLVALKKFINDNK